MAGEYTLRKASEQAFSLYARSLHPELFTIYVEREIHREHYSCTFWIIGSSHVVTFNAGEHILSEVLADARQELPVQFKIGSFAFGHNPQHGFRFDAEIGYDARFDWRRYDRGAFMEKVHEIRHAVLPNGILQVFPPSGDVDPELEMPTLTAVGFVPQERSLNVRTFHTFPEELSVIETHSRWEVHTD